MTERKDTQCKGWLTVVAVVVLLVSVMWLGSNRSRRMGTCSSMAVLYVALGRRLGYPLKLVTAKGHLFARWEDAHERFNIDVTGNGLNRFDDSYYRQGPFTGSDEEVKAEGYLKSLTPTGELAAFLSGHHEKSVLTAG